MKRKRRNHSASFKAKVAVAAIRGDKTLAELSEQFDVHQNQIQDWRRKLLGKANQVFDRGGSAPSEQASRSSVSGSAIVSRPASLTTLFLPIVAEFLRLFVLHQ